MALDMRYVQIVGLGIILHYYDICILGLCADTASLNPNFPSVLFAFAALNFITAFNLCPCPVVNVHPFLGRLFEVAASLVLADLAQRTVWIPFVSNATKLPGLLTTAITKVGGSFAEKEPLKTVLEKLAPDYKLTPKYTILVMAILLAVLSMQSTDFFKQLKEVTGGKGCTPEPPCPGQEEDCKQRSRSRSRRRRSRSRSRSRSMGRRRLSDTDFQTVN